MSFGSFIAVPIGFDFGGLECLNLDFFRCAISRTILYKSTDLASKVIYPQRVSTAPATTHNCHHCSHIKCDRIPSPPLPRCISLSPNQFMTNDHCHYGHSQGATLSVRRGRIHDITAIVLLKIAPGRTEDDTNALCLYHRQQTLEGGGEGCNDMCFGVGARRSQGGMLHVGGR